MEEVPGMVVPGKLASASIMKGNNAVLHVVVHPV
jgi:hypothetical protein